METGKLRTNTSFALLQAFQLWYIFDNLFFEESLLYTASLSAEKMNVFVYICLFLWFPFFSVVQIRYLSMYPVAFKWYCYVIPTLLQVVGYFIYRTSTLQKFLFRKDSNMAKKAGVRHITTSNGKNILVDGWWGKLRHPNYTGDFMMCVAWGALCGFYHLLPWLWPISLFFILVAMLINDDKRCEKKYGSSWQEYKERVKYRFIPYVY